jgi:hypothetical protein
MEIPDHQLGAAPMVLVDENRIPNFGIAGGLLLFVVATGCAVWLLPFGMVAQACLLLHVVDLWHPVGPKFRRAVLAGESDTYD